jgi:XRE family aerobic/anaerobic benzoate catabolism transcriptional regulator
LQDLRGADRNFVDQPLAEMVGDITTRSPEWLLIRELLEHRSEADLHRARVALHELLSGAPGDMARHRRIALIGLRGAGKSTLGPLLARDLNVPFIELNREIEALAGCSVREIHDLYGTTAYRRYERRALEEVVRLHREVVIATPGGIVSDPASFHALLAHCTTVWLRAAPEEHMGRVLAQGDMRPMAASSEAMEDLRRILEGRAAFYAKADFSVDTSGQTTEQSLARLRQEVRKLTAVQAEEAPL